MLFLLTIPARLVRLFDSNTSASEIAAGVCLGMFMGFVPLNGPMAVILILCFFVFRINRLATMLVLPVFKLFYFFGVYRLADLIGGFILIETQFLTGFWRIVTSMPILALLDLNNTLVSGGLLTGLILCFPVYIGSKKGVIVIRTKYMSRIKGSKIVLWVKKIPIISKFLALTGRLRGGV